MNLKQKAIMLRETLQLVLFKTTCQEAVKIGTEALRLTANLAGSVELNPPDGVSPAVWSEWISYRKKLGRCKDWESLFEHQKKWLLGQPLETRTEIINQSLRQGWQGLFEVRGSGKPVSAPSSQPSGMDKVIHQKEYERIIDRIRTIKNSYGEMQTWTRQDAAEFKRLLDRKKQLKSILGITL